MEREDSDTLVHGVVGGALAGAAVAAWFFLADAWSGQLFETPARLASAILGEEFRGTWPRHIFVYTILHFGVFVAMGTAAAAALAWFRVPPGLLLGAVFGVAVLNAAHYVGLLVSGTNLLTIVPVAHVFAANVLGGVLMMAYLRGARASAQERGAPGRSRLVLDGLGTGLAGAAAVALWFFLLDSLADAPLRTPSALGSALLLGASGPAEVRLDIAVVAAYSAAHVAAFSSLGVAFAWMTQVVERAPDFLLRALLLLALLEALFLGTLVILAGWAIPILGWPAIAGANLLAVAAMGGWIWRTHPALRSRLRRKPAQ
jgi:hypothetical protein